MSETCKTGFPHVLEKKITRNCGEMTFLAMQR